MLVNESENAKETEVDSSWYQVSIFRVSHPWNSDFYQIVCTAERDEQQIDIEKVQSIWENQGKD